jgi:hypothetical protein
LLHLVWDDNRNDSGFVLSDIYYKKKRLDNAEVDQYKSIYIQKQRIKIYPNPFNHEINVRGASYVAENGMKKCDVKMYDICGREILLNLTNGEEYGRLNNVVKIKTKDLPNGVYFIRVIVDGVDIVNKMIKITKGG